MTGVRLRTEVILVAAGFLLRLCDGLRWVNFENWEAGNVARAIAGGRGFSDAYFPGQGPTAHLMPVMPLIGGAVYAVFGTGTLGACVLLLGSISISIACYLLSARIVRRLGATRGVVLVGLAFAMLVPLHDNTEIARWQAWDGGLATLLLLATLAVILAAEHGRRFAGFDVVRALLPALALLTSPIAGLAAAVCALIFIWFDRRQSGMLRPLAALAAAIIVLFTPWVARNEATFRQVIVTRDNLGLELAIANHPGAVAPADPEQTFVRRMEAVHPSVGMAARRRLIASGGEVAYSNWIGGQTRRWMTANPVSVARIWLRHLTEILVPRPWMFRIEHERPLAWLRAGLNALVDLAGLTELALLLRSRTRLAVYPLVVIVVVVGSTMPFQPVMRYCWLLYPLLVMLAAGLGGRFARSLRRRTADGDAGSETGLPVAPHPGAATGGRATLFRIVRTAISGDETRSRRRSTGYS